MKLSACIDMFFTEVPFTQRVAAARQAGFDAVEFWAWHGKDLPALTQALQETQTPVAAMCVSSADEGKVAQLNERGLLDADQAGLFAEMVEESCQLAHTLGNPALIVTAGQARADLSREAQQDYIIRCLEAAAPVLQAHQLTLVLEPLNVLVDHPGHYLNTSRQALDILQAVNCPQVKMLFDIYHQQITEGNLIANLTRCLPWIGHIHTADVPGRHQFGTGEIHYRNVLAALEQGGYQGYVGCEYTPMGCTSAESAAAVMAAAGRS